MSTSITSIIIILITVALFVIDKFPLALVSMLSLLAFIFTGVLSFSDAFAGFASNLVMLVAGMMIIGNALYDNGVAERVGELLFRRFRKSERALLIAVLFVAAVLSAFLHNTSVMVMFMPIITAYASKPNAIIQRKNFFMPLAHVTIIGGCASLCGSSPPLLAQGVLTSNESIRGLSFFETSMVAIPLLIVVLLCYYLFLFKMEKKVFSFSENLPEAINTDQAQVGTYVKWKQWVTGLVMIGCAIAFATVKSVSLGVISLTGACILILFGCVNGKTALKKIDWSTLIILGAATGFAKAFTVSGIGEKMIDWIVNILGDAATSPFLWVIVFTFLSNIIANFMAASAATVIFSTLAVSVGIQLGIDPVPLVVAIIFGVCCAFIMPTATSTVTMTTVAGYRFRDYVKIGSVVSLICCITIILAVSIIYGLL